MSQGHADEYSVTYSKPAIWSGTEEIARLVESSNPIPPVIEKRAGQVFFTSIPLPLGHRNASKLF